MRYVGRNVFSSSHPLPFFVQQHPSVHLFRRTVEEVGAAFVFAHLDVIVDIVAPVLRGKAAARFVEEADRNAKERRGSIDFTKQVAKMRSILKRSKLYREG